MELRHLRYFVAVAEELNFTRAAERLYTSQPSLSEQIRNLEEEIGYPLLNRTRRKVELTEAGVIFLDDAREILHKVEEAVQRAGKAASQAREVLTIGFVPAAEVRIFPAVLPAFRAAFPQVDVVLRSLTSNEQEGAWRVASWTWDSCAARCAPPMCSAKWCWMSPCECICLRGIAWRLIV